MFCDSTALKTKIKWFYSKNDMNVKSNMESKITLTKHNTKEELYVLFVNGRPLPGIKLAYQESTEKKIYHKLFHNVLATNNT
jgi:hypothetical protein